MYARGLGSSRGRRRYGRPAPLVRPCRVCGKTHARAVNMYIYVYIYITGATRARVTSPARTPVVRTPRLRRPDRTGAPGIDYIISESENARERRDWLPREHPRRRVRHLPPPTPSSSSRRHRHPAGEKTDAFLPGVIIETDVSSRFAEPFSETSAERRPNRA